MARTKISEFSDTAADNTDINNIDIAEGCAPSGINNAIREMMKQLKDFQSGTSGDPLVSTSTVTATKLVPTGNVTAGNGMYLPAANTVAFSTNGSEKVRVDNNGNVGIGTTAPTELLHVDGKIRIGTQATATTDAVRADRTISTGSGLTGGGNLTANRTFAVDNTVLRNTTGAVTNYNATFASGAGNLTIVNSTVCAIGKWRLVNVNIEAGSGGGTNSDQIRVTLPEPLDRQAIGSGFWRPSGVIGNRRQCIVMSFGSTSVRFLRDSSGYITGTDLSTTNGEIGFSVLYPVA